MVHAVVIVALLSVTVQADDNGLARLPPMGWRSWNAFYADIDTEKITAQIDALVALRAADGSVDTNGTASLSSLGFGSIGIDEGWEGCGLGVNGTVHYANGTPTVDPKRFPDMPGLVRYGRSKGVKMGFYLNGCGCNERKEHRINYEGDVRATVAWGFDAVKIDSCGAQRNMTLYNMLINATGKALEVENCHQGHNFTDGGNPGQMGPGWCPYNLFRTSNDITNLWDRVMSNLMTVVPFLMDAPNSSSPLSRPGCWAYPDMLEVGRMPEHNVAESRSHFSAWAIVSAPLVLGFDLRDQKQMSAAWPIISNEEVMKISQTWVTGSASPSGRLVKSWQADNVPTLSVRGRCSDAGCVDKDEQCPEWAAKQQCFLNRGFMLANCQKSCGSCSNGNFSSFAFDKATGTLRSGDLCLDSEGLLPPAVNTQNVMHLQSCTSGKASQKWTFNGTNGEIRSDAAGSCLTTLNTWLWNYVKIATLGGCGKGGAMSWTLHTNGTLSNAKDECVAVSTNSGPPSTVWAKPLAEGRQAVLMINGADKGQQIDLDFSGLGIGASSWSTRSVWDKKDLGAKRGFSAFLGPHDCALLVLSPESEVAVVI